MRTVSVAIVLSLTGVLAVGGCRNDAAAPDIVEPPSFIRATVPADSAEGIFGVTDISVTFRRSVPQGSARLSLYPAPISAGSQVLSPTGRNLGWLNVELDRAPMVYRLLVDGSTIPFPELIEFFPTTRPGVSGRMGGCLSLFREGPNLKDAVVFVLEPGDFNLNPLELPAFFRQVHPTSVATVGLSPGECDEFYFFTYLEVKAYVVVAVLDTGGDGRYDLQQDWYGTLGNSNVVLTAQPSDSVFDTPRGYNILVGPPR